jgi:hypothetical protein
MIPIVSKIINNIKINITIKIMFIIHRTAFYLKLNSTQLYRFFRTSQETRLRYEPNRLMLL